MKSLKVWMIHLPLLVASVAAAVTAYADENDVASAMASLKAGLARQASMHQATHSSAVARPQEVCQLAERIIAESTDADSLRMKIGHMAIESVFVDRAVDRLNTDWLPPQKLVISPMNSFDINAFDSSWPRRDPAARIEVKLLGDWWARDFGARHGGPELSFGASGTYREVPADPQWVEDDARFTLDAMLKIDRVSLYGAVIDKEADAPFAGHMTDNQGAMVQAGFFLIPDRIEPFVRYEWPGIDASDGAGGVSTVGVNYYIKPHAARFTLAVAWTDPGRSKPGTPSNFDGGGLVRDGTRDEVSFRAQLQLLF